VAAALLAVMTGRVAQHLDPVWRDRSNFVIAADVSVYSDLADLEQLWVRQISDDRFELCCIPFFLYDVALGDVVETRPAGGRRYMLDRVVERSGRFVFRVWFGDTHHPRDEVASDLGRMGALLEWSSVNLLAVDAVDQESAEGVASYLAAAEVGGRLVFETGKSA